MGYGAGLLDLAAGPDIAAHPALYTHHPSFGVYVSYLLHLLGIEDIRDQSLLMVLPFGAGIAYLYAFLRGAVGQRTATLTLAHLAPMYLLVAHWAFNLSRGFSWLGLFGAAYHLHQACSQAGARRNAHLGMCLGALLIAYAVDLIHAVVATLFLALLIATRVIQVGRLTALVVLIVWPAVFVLARAIQVTAALGWDFLLWDLGVTIVRRVPILRVFGIASTMREDELSGLIHSLGVVIWPPGDTAFTPSQWLVDMARGLAAVLGVTPLAATIALACGAGILWTRTRPRVDGPVSAEAATVGPSDPRQGKNSSSSEARRLTLAIIALLVPQVLTLVLIGELYAHFYGRMLLPMMVHVMVLILARATLLLWDAARRAQGALRRVLLACLLALALWRGATEVGHLILAPPTGYPGQDVLRTLSGEGVAVFGGSTPVSAYTGTWAAGLNDLKWRYLSPEDVPFVPDRDYLYFFERDRANRAHAQPTYLLVPGTNIRWLGKRRCEPYGYAIVTRADGCDDMELVARGVAGFRLVARGADYLLYDLRADIRTGGSAIPP
ncbi:MAG: hypothetical protein FJ033_11385 [Chloroflexi bacterium]|nr:hypothetical protein [Chloroflexota bacterium]